MALWRVAGAIGVDPRPLTARQLVWMQEGHAADRYTVTAILAGTFNRLGDGKGRPLEIKPPAWLTRATVRETRAELDMARAAFTRFVDQRQNAGGGGGGA